MNVLIYAILPIFLIVVFGFFLSKLKIVSSDITKPLMNYVFYGAAPGIVFYAIISNPVSKLLYWRFWLAYPLSLCVIIIITFVIFKLALKRSGFISCLAGFCAAMANTVIIGYPVLSGFIGHAAAIPMAITVLVFAAVFIPVLIFFFEIKVSIDKGDSTEYSSLFKSALMGSIKNPIIIAVILAATLVLSDIPIPNFVSKFSFYLGESIVPVALFSVGVDLGVFKVGGTLADVVVITFINLLIAPLISIAIALLFKMSPIFAVALVIFSTVPTAKTLYMIAGKYQIYNKEVAAVISSTTLFSVFTIPFYAYIAQLIWPSVFHLSQ